jgi:hypothetical protein
MKLQLLPYCHCKSVNLPKNANDNAIFCKI